MSYTEAATFTKKAVGRVTDERQVEMGTSGCFYVYGKKNHRVC